MPGVEKNRNYVAEITGMTHEGQGVGRIEGLAVFIDGALEGEQVETRIIKLNKTYAVGKLVAVLKPSPDRAEPFCSAYRRCGGCNLQHMDYNAQLAFKKKLVRDNLERIGGLKDILVHETIGMEKPLNYRNKAQYPVAEVNGSVITGFYAARSHEVIDSEECGIQDIESDRVRKVVRQFIMENGIPVYDEKRGNGLLRHIVTRVGFNTGEIMVVLVINGKKLPHSDELVRRLIESGKAVNAEIDTAGTAEAAEMAKAAEIAKAAEMAKAVEIAIETAEAIEMAVKSAGTTEAIEIAKAVETTTEATGIAALTKAVEATAKTDGITEASNIKSIYLNINTENTNVILGRKNNLLYGSKTIIDRIGQYRFLISPHSFFQVNPVQTEILYSKALEYAALTGNETVFDLYCGIGTISLFLSARAGKVYGVEVVEEAVEDARMNVELNGVTNVEFIPGEAEKEVPELYKRGVRADVVVLDPPRKGCEESLLQLLAEMQPKRIVYVSCNPATLARDLKYLDERGYKAVEAQPVDMFPWTAHVEAVILLQRQKP